ncbi:glycosyltransferase family 1 protein [Cryobacterium sp. M15]|uniref:glycosyltransferase family 4 protein n=1 Tax=Cryobacterium sp. M15 TaxID=2048291 RepID=UPI001E2C2F2F|nr:glycosyltransferase family 1 protein [Cryobacterium sp. M15]
MARHIPDRPATLNRGPLVLFDATAVPANRGGVGRYVDGLLAELGGRIEIACQLRDAAHFRSIAPHAAVLPQAIGIESPVRRLIWEQLQLPALARRRGATVIHSPHYTLPLFTTRARVVTLHDATFFSDPHVHTWLKGAFFRLWTRISVRLARQIIVPSQATADEVNRYTRRHVTFVVAHHGVDFDVFHRPTPQQIQQVSKEYDLGEPGWITFLGTLEPRKNLPALIRAYGLVATSMAGSGLLIPPLVLVGARGWDSTIEAEIAALPAVARVKTLGYVPANQLSAILGGAAVMVYPSLGEGFGLPVLEAMACGTPVLTTRCLALPEVGGDAVAYSETTEVSIATELLALLSAPDRQADLSMRGEIRAHSFTWSSCARTHTLAYRRARAI